MQKKLLGILLALCMLLSVLPFALTAAASDEHVTEVPEGYTGISDEAGLAALMADTNAITGNYILMADITLTEATTQSPIGDSATAAFSGIFDGNGYSINGINLVTTDTSANIWGLFGYVNGTVKNLTAYGTVSAKATVTSGGANGVGGVIGVFYNGVALQNIENHINVTAAGKAGGVVGQSYITASTPITMENLANYGDVTSSGSFVGGVFGRFDTGASAAITLSNVYNEGAVTATQQANKIYAAGIAGIYSAYNGTIVDNVWNAGTISSYNAAAGIFGYHRSYSKKPSVITATRLVNTGNIVMTGSDLTPAYAGGIICYTEAGCGQGIKDVFLSGKFTLPAGVATGSDTYVYTDVGVINNTAITNSYLLEGTTALKGSRVAPTTVELDTDLSAVFTAAEGWMQTKTGPELAAYHTCKGEYYESTSAEEHNVLCRCGAVVSTAAHTLDANGVCEQCGYTDCQHPDAVWTKDGKATCVTPGIEGYYCPVCQINVIDPDTGVAEKEYYNEENHESEDVKYVSTTTGGAKVRACCEEVLESYTVPANGVLTTANDVLALMLTDEEALLNGVYTLGANISLAGLPTQQPIGSVDHPFSGSIDGGIYDEEGNVTGMYTISDIAISGTTTATALFGKVLDGASFANMKIDGTVTSTAVATGGFVGSCGGSVSFVNCVNSVDVTGAVRTGGFIGSYDAEEDGVVLFQDCVNEGKIVSNGKSGSDIAIHAGGFFGRMSSTASATGTDIDVLNCKNTGEIVGADCVGGFCGRFDIGATENASVLMQDFVNTGKIRSLTADDMASGVALPANLRYVGGMFGLFNVGTSGTTSAATGTTAQIDRFHNEGEIVATGNYAGGLAGFFRRYTEDGTSVSVTNAINIAAVSSDADCVGGLFGQIANGAVTITKCYSAGGVQAMDGAANVGPIYGVAHTTTDAYVTKLYYNAVEGDTYTEGIADNATEIITTAEATEDVLATDLTEVFTTDGWYVNANNEPRLQFTCVHVFDENNKCTVCGLSNAAECEHLNATEWTITETATCLKTGEKARICPDCGETLETATYTDANNHVQTKADFAINPESGNVEYTAPCCGTIVLSAPILTDIYLDKENGTTYTNVIADLQANPDLANLGTQEMPFDSMTPAYSYATKATTKTTGDDNVTIHVVGAYSIVSWAPAASVQAGEMITFTGDGDGSLVSSGECTLRFSNPITFKDIYLDNTGTLYIAGQNNKLVMDTGVTTNFGGDKNGKVYVVGGWSYIKNNTDAEGKEYAGDVTIRSGEYHIVSAGNRFISETTAGGKNAKLTLGKKSDTDSLIIHNLYPTAVNKQTASADLLVTLTVDGPVQLGSVFAASTGVSTATAGIKYDVDLLLLDDLQPIGETAWAWSTQSATADGTDGTWTVYSGKNAQADDVALIDTIGNVDVVKYTYADYCIKVNGEHPDENTDKTCDYCGLWLGCTEDSHPENTNNAWTLNAETGKYEVLCNVEGCGKAVYTADQPYYYVDQAAGSDSENNGLSAVSAFATIDAAVAKMATTGGKVILAADYSVADGTVVTPHTGTITYTTAAYVAGGKASYGFVGPTVRAKTFTMGGPTVFEGIAFTCKEWAIAAAWNDITFGDGIVNLGTASTSVIWLVAGKYNETALTGTGSADKFATVTIGAVEGATLFGRVYLGCYTGTNGDEKTGEIVVYENQNVVLNATDAVIGSLYIASTNTAGRYYVASKGNVTANLYGTTDVVTGVATGDNNVNTSGQGYVEQAVLNLYDNSTVEVVNARNINNFTINVSVTQAAPADAENAHLYGREVKIPGEIVLFAYGANFDGAKSVTTVNYSTHSFTRHTPARFSNTWTENQGTLKMNPVVECTNLAAPTYTYTEIGGSLTKTTACADCGYAVSTETVAWDCELALGAHKIAAHMVDGEVVVGCLYCDEAVSATGDLTFTVTPASIVNGSVTVTVSAATAEGVALAIADLVVSAPEGFTLTGVKNLLPVAAEDASGWTMLTADANEDGTYTLPYTVALLHLVQGEDGNYTDAALNSEIIEYTFSVAETFTDTSALITVSSNEAATMAEDLIDTVCVAAQVTVAAEAPECDHANTKLVNNKNGTHNVVCANEDCGEVITENVACTLEEVAGSAVESTCTVAGKDADKACACGYTVEGAARELAKHTETTETKDATCTEAGYTKVTCSVCGKTISETVIEATGHTETTETKDATCTEAGYTKVTCSVCGEIISETVIEATGHTEVTETKEATCTEAGYTKVTCSVCGEIISETVIEATGHRDRKSVV